MDRIKPGLPTAFVAFAVAVMLVHGPIAQLEHYHEFADTRSLFGIPNAGDVISNVGFAIVGLWGLWSLRNRRADPSVANAWTGYCVFLGAVALTALGSSYYHLAPDNGRLLWDRLPIALACAGLLAAVRGETHGPQPTWVLPALIAAAITSVLWWSVTESQGGGDLRPYLLLQGAPLVLIPLWQWIARSPLADRFMFGVAILLYALAKMFELSDHAVFDVLGAVSGHTIKHLLATAAGAVLAANVIRKLDRQPSSRPSFADLKSIVLP